MHAEAYIFLQTVQHLYPTSFVDSRVLGCGDLNINGSARELFTNCDYTGIDAEVGNGVDWVGLIHEYQSDQPFDVVVSTESAEHDPYFPQSLDNMLSLLKPGGLFVFTCASYLRPEHGTARTGSAIYGPDPNYYRNDITIENFTELLAGRLDPVRVLYGQQGMDVYAVGTKK